MKHRSDQAWCRQWEEISLPLKQLQVPLPTPPPTHPPVGWVIYGHLVWMTDQTYFSSESCNTICITKSDISSRYSHRDQTPKAFLYPMSNVKTIILTQRQIRRAETEFLHCYSKDMYSWSNYRNWERQTDGQGVKTEPIREKGENLKMTAKLRHRRCTRVKLNTQWQ